MPTNDERWRKDYDDLSEDKGLERDRTQQAVMEETEEDEDLEDEGRAPSMERDEEAETDEKESFDTVEEESK